MAANSVPPVLRTGADIVPVLEMRDLTKVYGEGTDAAVTALRGITFTVMPGEFVSIMGQSGSGKSTLLHVLGCLHKATAGLYRLDGVDVTTLDDDNLSKLRNEKIGFVFQKFNLLPQENIVENVALPLIYARVPKPERMERARRVLCMRSLALSERPSVESGRSISSR